MHKDRIAEWLLESVTTREGAATTVGDLREIAATRGEAWFWWSVFSTAGLLLWHGVSDHPRRMLSLAIRAWLVSVGLGAIAGLLAVFLMGVLRGSLAFREGPVVGVQWLWKVLLPTIAALISLNQFLTGRWVARRAAGRELSACLAFAMLQALLAAIAIGPRGLDNSWFFLAYPFCFLGALTVRRRRAVAHSGS